MLKLLILMLSFTFVGCAHSFHSSSQNYIKQCYVPAMVFTNGLDKELNKIVKNSFEHWNDVSQKQLFLYGGDTDIDPDSSKSIAITMVLIRDMPSNILTSRKIAISEKRHCIVGAKVYVNRLALSNPMLETAIRKEAGYILGLSSSPDFTSLMYSGVEPTQQHPIDANDEEIKEIKTIYEIF